MLGQLISSLVSRRRRSTIAPHIPEGCRVYAVGDIHGCLDPLEDLLGQIAADDAGRGAAGTTVIILGDVIDRGPASAQVIDRLLAFRDAFGTVRCLMGNHEEVFTRLLSGEAEVLPFFLNIGGEATLASYGLAKPRDMPADDVIAYLNRVLPKSHRRFFDALENIITIGDYTFVHAGIRPAIPIDEQPVTALRWIREEFLQSRKDHGKFIVHGHSMDDDVVVMPNRIGIDTGAYVSGRLTAIGLESGERWFLQSAI